MQILLLLKLPSRSDSKLPPELKLWYKRKFGKACAVAAFEELKDVLSMNGTSLRVL